ncbi:hypothetical protein RvY_04455-3 [Ramazzottius varieornatus]|uniref:Secreted protein n=1 Tax=Ramazzottius varieornatus TaxID=947166 RepID=A0A1D1V1N4_RAMVA|nr:hypothetical protein RvY_04455-3 [Ramazzottius varieornatus]
MRIVFPSIFLQQLLVVTGQNPSFFCSYCSRKQAQVSLKLLNSYSVLLFIRLLYTSGLSSATQNVLQLRKALEEVVYRIQPWRYRALKFHHHRRSLAWRSEIPRFKNQPSS